MKIITLFLCLISYHLHAIPEAELQGSWENKALNYFLNMNSGTFENTEGLKISFSYRLGSSNKKKLIFVPGRTEPALKYAEVLYDLKDQGYDLFIMDHQGQGKSSRLLKDSQKGHINNFSDYVKDLHTFISDVVLSKGNDKAPLFIIAHSMGGAISIKLMEKWPTLVKKAVLVAPMIEMNTAEYPEAVARLYAKFLVLAGKGKTYAPGYGPYLPEVDIFENNFYTNSEERFNISKSISLNYPHLVVSGPTVRWVHESLKVTKKIYRAKLQLPLLLFQAGLDQIVKPRRQKVFCLKNNCQFYLIPDAHHEILMEKDIIRDEVLRKIQDFFNS